MTNYIPTLSINAHLENALPELQSIFKDFNEKVLAISNEIKAPYATGASICYRLGNGTRFLELKIQKKKLKLFLRNKRGKFIDKNNLIGSSVPNTHKWGAGIILYINPNDLTAQKSSLNNYLDLVKQSFNFCL